MQRSTPQSLTSTDRPCVFLYYICSRSAYPRSSWLLRRLKARPWQRSVRSCFGSVKRRSARVTYPNGSVWWPFRKPSRSLSSAKSMMLAIVASARTTSKKSSRKLLRSVSLHLSFWLCLLKCLWGFNWGFFLDLNFTFFFFTVCL